MVTMPTLTQLAEALSAIRSFMLELHGNEYIEAQGREQELMKRIREMEMEGKKVSGFKPATKQMAKLRLALCGPSGSGKTFSALRVAAGLGGKLAVIDTERGSASLYADKFQFDVLNLDPPYQPAKYVQAIKDAETAGYEVLVIDSLSHAWAGEGGILETVDDTAQKSGNKFTAWAPATKQQNALINAILGTRLHIVATMRSKQEYALEADHRGKMVPKKLGMAPVQRDGVEYEFATVLDIGMSHEASVGMSGKDRTGLFEGQPARQLTEEDGKRILVWLGACPPPSQAVTPKTDGQHGIMSSVQKEASNMADDLAEVHRQWSERIKDLADDTDFNATAAEVKGIADKALRDEIAKQLGAKARKEGLEFDKKAGKYVRKASAA